MSFIRSGDGFINKRVIMRCSISSNWMGCTRALLAPDGLRNASCHQHRWLSICCRNHKDFPPPSVHLLPMALSTISNQTESVKRQFGTTRRSSKKRPRRLRVHPDKYKAYKLIRRNAALGVRFPAEAKAMTVKHYNKKMGTRNTDKKRDQQQRQRVGSYRPKNLFSVTNHSAFLALEGNSVELGGLLGREMIANTRNGEEQVIVTIGDGRVPGGEGIEGGETNGAHEELETTTADLVFKELAELQTFKQFNLRSEVQAMILKSGLITPTQLQKLVIPKILTGKKSCSYVVSNKSSLYGTLTLRKSKVEF